MTSVEEHPYVTDEATGKNWRLLLGDSCERLAEVDDESVDLSIYSPPFASLFTYSPSDRDLGNSATTEQFIEHYAFIIDEMLRVTKPGRLSAVHVQQIATQKVRDGAIGIEDFRGKVIAAHVAAGWIFHGEVTVWKNPQAQAVRTKAQSLLFVTLRRDSSISRPAFADYVLMFRKPGDNATPILPDVDNETWIEWASPVWYGIRETDTLNAAAAREDADERHICLARDSLVLTRGGYRPIQEVAVGEHVLTHKGRWRPVLAVQNTGVRGVVTVRGQGVPGLTLTPDHKLWTRATTGAPSQHRRSASRATPDWAPAAEVTNHYVNLKLPTVEPPSVADPRLWWVVGRWLADGHWAPLHKGRQPRWEDRIRRQGAVISCGHHEAADLLAGLGGYGTNPHRDTGTALQILLHDPDYELRRILKDCGEGAAGKHLPAEAYTLPPEQAKALLDGYLSGDGHYRPDRNRWMASSVSKELMLGVAMLAQRVHGAIASVYPGRPARAGIIAGRTVNMRADWVLSFDVPDVDRRKGLPFLLEDGAWKKVRSVQAAGQVETWNLRVEEDESYTAEGCIVKNCPLQLSLIERCVRLWSNPSETVLSPFAGIGSEGYEALHHRRRFLGIELKRSYWETAVRNLTEMEWALDQPTLFEASEAHESAAATEQMPRPT